MNWMQEEAQFHIPVTGQCGLPPMSLSEMDEDARKNSWKSFPLKQSPNGSLTTWIRMMPWTLSVK